MKYSKQDRMEIGRRIYEGELTRNQAAEEYGISIETARNYTYLYRDSNGLPNRRRAGGSLSAAAVSAGAAENPAASLPIPGADDLESMSREELIRELVRYRVNEARSKKGYRVEGVGAARRFVPTASRSIR